MTLAQTLEAFGATYLRLGWLLDAAAEPQWQPGQRTPREPGDTGRGRGGHSDHTFATAADERRLRLRDRVVEAERAMRAADVAMREAEATLRDALAEA